MRTRPTLVLATLLCLAPFAAGVADDKDPEAVVEDMVEEAGDAAEGEAEDADLGEASYNTRDCEDETEDADGEVEADDLDAECEPMVK